MEDKLKDNIMTALRLTENEYWDFMRALGLNMVDDVASTQGILYNYWLSRSPLSLTAHVVQYIKEHSIERRPLADATANQQ